MSLKDAARGRQQRTPGLGTKQRSLATLDQQCQWHSRAESLTGGFRREDGGGRVLLARPAPRSKSGARGLWTCPPGGGGGGAGQRWTAGSSLSKCSFCYNWCIYLYSLFHLGILLFFFFFFLAYSIYFSGY